jgi:phage terminase large subunit GpA-like protein
VWEKIPGHQRNEALDCRNYANAAFRVWNPDLNRIFQKLKEPVQKPAPPLVIPKKKKTNVFNIDW